MSSLWASTGIDRWIRDLARRRRLCSAWIVILYQVCADVCRRSWNKRAVLSQPKVVTSSILYQVNYLLCDSNSLYVTGVCGKYCVFQYLETESLLWFWRGTHCAEINFERTFREDYFLTVVKAPKCRLWNSIPIELLLRPRSTVCDSSSDCEWFIRKRTNRIAAEAAKQSN